MKNESFFLSNMNTKHVFNVDMHAILTLIWCSNIQEFSGVFFFFLQEFTVYSPSNNLFVLFSFRESSDNFLLSFG